MGAQTSEKQLAAELSEMLGPTYPGIEVEIGQNPRWQRRCVTFRWGGFADLLPEERFHRLVRAIPEEYRVAKLAGAVWLELAPNETVDQFLQQPRSEDVAERESAIYGRLIEAGLFGRLESAMQPAPDRACAGDFSRTRSILSDKGFGEEDLRDAKLSLIRHGAYCDCQVLLTARPEFSRTYPGVTEAGVGAT